MFLFPLLPSHFPLVLGTSPVQVACPACWHVGSRSLARHSTAWHGTVSRSLPPVCPPHSCHPMVGTGKRTQRGSCSLTAGEGNREETPARTWWGRSPGPLRGAPNRTHPRPGMGTGTRSTRLGQSPRAHEFQELPAPPVPTASPSPASPPSPARYPRTLRPVSPAPPAAAPASPVLLLLRPHPVPRISRCLPPLPRPGPTAPPSRTVPVLPGAPARSWPRNSSGAAPSAPVGGAAGAGGSRSRSRSLPVGVAGAPRSRRARPHLPRSAHRPQPPVPGAPLPPCRSEAAPVPPYRAPAWPGPSPRCGSAPGARLGPAGTCPAAPGGNTGVPHRRGCRTGARRGLEGGRPRTGRGGTAGSPPGHRCDEPGGLSPALLNAAHQEIPSGDKGRSSRVCVTHTGSSTSGGLWGGSREWRSQPHRVRITGLEGPPAGMSADG